MQTKDFTVYTINNCPYCVRAKNLLTSLGHNFTEILISTDDDNARIELGKKTGMKTMPQIFYGEKLIGGFSDLDKLHSEGQLKNLSLIHI